MNVKSSKTRKLLADLPEGAVVRFGHYRVPLDRAEDSERQSKELNGRISEPHSRYLLSYSRKFGFKKGTSFEGKPPSSKGGATWCRILVGDDHEANGFTHCSLMDNFCYAIGREIALGRALAIFHGEVL